MVPGRAAESVCRAELSSRQTSTPELRLPIPSLCVPIPYPKPPPHRRVALSHLNRCRMLNPHCCEQLSFSPLRDFHNLIHIRVENCDGILTSRCNPHRSEERRAGKERRYR